MTRLSQKQEEREILLALFSAIGIQPANGFSDGETPDFAMRLSDRVVGVEVTLYRSERAVAGIKKRAVESEWESFERASGEFRERHPELKNMYVLFRWKSTVPPEAKRLAFFQEILEFVRSHAVGSEYSVFSANNFTTPLMLEYLKGIGGIVLKRCQRGGWDSNTTAGFVDDHVAQGVSRIVKSKSAKKYRREVKIEARTTTLDELWLVIKGTGQPSETMLPIKGVSEFNENHDLHTNLKASPFTRVYAFTTMGLLEWEKRPEKWRITAAQ
jgi:hypothetical protein